MFRYAVKRISTAKSIVLTPEPGSTTAGRWRDETRATMKMVEPLLGPNARVLDYGAGPGRLTKAILRAQPAVQVVAVDSSPQMLKLLPTYVGPRLMTRVRLVEFTGVTQLRQDLSRDRFDLALAVYVLQHVSKDILREVLQTILLSLKPGGKFFVINSTSRCVPCMSAEERGPKTLEERNNLVRTVARRVGSGDRYWSNDGIDMRRELSAVFGQPRYVSMRRVGVARSIWSGHFAAIYTRRKSV